MRLSNLITPADGAFLSGPDKDILGIACDSRHVRDGFLFVAVPGTQKDASAFVPDALARGAVAVVTKRDACCAVPPSVTHVKATDVRPLLSKIASRFHPRQPQTVAAVTGTSGKTSTVHFTQELWTRGKHKAASLGTLGLLAPGVKLYGSLTTPDAISLHQTLDQIAGQGVTHLAMEASSHGIELNRLDCVNADIAAFTNLSRDHLDYHETMERYFDAKARLFTTIVKSGGAAVLNADVPEYERLKGLCTARRLKILSFGKTGSELRLLSCAPDEKGQRLSLEVLGKKTDVLLPLIGSFQVFNSLTALAIAIASGENPDKMVAVLGTLSGVPGRLERIGATTCKGTVFVDYAHKPAALENVLCALRLHVQEHPGAKLHVIFGCGGNRDKGKRPLMGAIAQRLADIVIVTDDNPRDENAADIRKEILAGCALIPSVREIGDRAQAIRAGIEGLAAHDILVVAGKGHEEGQIVGNETIPFNDANIVRALLKEQGQETA